MSGKGKPDNEGGALVIPEKATSQLATVAPSKDPVAAKRLQGRQLPMRAAKLNKLATTSLSVPKPATNQTQNDSTSEDEDEDIHETVGGSDPDYREIDSYD